MERIVTELTDQQSKFVVCYVANGGNGAEAAREAGYAENSSRQAAYKLLRIRHVQDAINKEMRREITSMTALGLGKLKAVLNHPDTKATVILDATIKLADRAGLAPKSDADSASDSKPISELSLAELNALIAQHEANMGAGGEVTDAPDESEAA